MGQMGQMGQKDQKDHVDHEDQKDRVVIHWNPWDQETWDELKSYGTVNDTWTNVEKLFAIELWKNNIKCILETYHLMDVQKVSMIQDMFII